MRMHVINYMLTKKYNIHCCLRMHAHFGLHACMLPSLRMFAIARTYLV